MTEDASAPGDVSGDVAERIREDPYCSRLGIEFTTIESGYAEATLTATESMCNFNGKVHGGVLFSLADATGAAAGNAAGVPTVGIETSTSFLTAVDAGETVTARAEVTHTGRTTNQIRVEVVDEAGDLVATFVARGYKLD